MRAALFEALYDDEVPVEVAIDEAVELAKEYCGVDAPGFVNGVLGAAVAPPGPSSTDPGPTGRVRDEPEPAT